MDNYTLDNSTSDGEPLNIPMVTVCLVSSALGFVLNILVMSISTTRKDVKGNYKFYMFNLAFVDCCGIFFYGALALCLCFTYYSPNNDMFACSLFIFATDWILTASLACMVPMTIHRRLSFDFAQRIWFQKYFSKPALICSCIVIDLLCCLFIGLDYFLNAFRGSVDSGDVVFCSVTPPNDSLDDDLPVFPLQQIVRFTCLPFVIVVNFLTYVRLRKYIRTVRSDLEKKMLHEKRNLALASLAHTIAIIVGQMPDQIITLLDQITDLFSDFTSSQWDNVTFAVNLCNMLNFVVNPVMTLIIIKPYREAIVTTWRRFFRNSGISVTTVTALR